MSSLCLKELLHSEPKTDENAGFQWPSQSPEQSLGTLCHFLPQHSDKGEHLHE